MRRMNGRQRTVLAFGAALLFLALITIAGQVFAKEAMATDFSRKNLAPCVAIPWHGLDGTGYVCPYPDRLVHEYPHWAFGSRGQRAFGPVSWNCVGNHGKGRGFHGNLDH